MGSEVTAAWYQACRLEHSPRRSHHLSIRPFEEIRLLSLPWLIGASTVPGRRSLEPEQTAPTFDGRGSVASRARALGAREGAVMMAPARPVNLGKTTHYHIFRRTSVRVEHGLRGLPARMAGHWAAPGPEGAPESGGKLAPQCGSMGYLLTIAYRQGLRWPVALRDAFLGSSLLPCRPRLRALQLAATLRRCVRGVLTQPSWKAA
jgi:hypothetical protein